MDTAGRVTYLAVPMDLARTTRPTAPGDKELYHDHCNSGTDQQRSSRAKSQERLALALIAPTLIVLTIVIVIPVIQSVKQALYGQPGLDPETGFVNETEPFVGMKNFADIFTGSGERF